MHAVGRGREDLRDDAGSAPRDNVLGTSSGELELGVSGRHVDFYAVAEGEVGGSAVFVETIRGGCLHVGVVRGGEAVEGSGRSAKGISVSCR